ESSAHQCADIPLAAGLLGAGVALRVALESTSARTFCLAGLLAGAPVLIKNEGLALAAVFAAVAVVWFLAHPRLRARALTGLPLLLAGLAVFPVAAVAFKLTLAPPGDLTMHNSPARMMENLLDPARWGMIAGWVFQEPFVLKHWLGWLLPVFVVAAWKGWRDFLAGGRLIPLVLLIVLAQGAAFIGVYLVTPRSLAWHLATSYHRLLFQLWPVLVLLACLPLKEALGGRIEAGVVDPPPGDHAAISRQGNRVGA
ncbi:MAG: hypothetical protein KJ787_05775, partial [Gammaproteobacteria bacterium]|nr:hypothetical protein [Gammaproteobacteria bacterium]